MHQAENALDGITTTVNDRVDAYDEGLDSKQRMRPEDADLKAPASRNNLKLRGVTESILPSDLMQYPKSLFSSMLPELTDPELTIDPIHCLSKLIIKPMLWRWPH